MIEQLKSPATILAIVPFINMGIRLLLDKAFGVGKSISRAKTDANDDMKKIAEDKDLVGYLSTYIENGSNIRRFFESTILALIASVVGYFTSKANHSMASDFWFVLVLIIGGALAFLGIRLYSDKIDFARSTETRTVKWSALLLNVIVIALDGYSKNV